MFSQNFLKPSFARLLCQWYIHFCLSSSMILHSKAWIKQDQWLMISCTGAFWNPTLGLEWIKQMSSHGSEFSYEKCQAFGYTWCKIQGKIKITRSCHYELIIGILWCFFLFKLSSCDLFEPIMIRHPLWWSICRK